MFRAHAMSTHSLFSSALTHEHEHYRWNLWSADWIDLGLGAAFGWGLARYLDVAHRAVPVLLLMALAYVVYATVAGARRQTYGRWIAGLRLVGADGRAPGLVRAFVRALLVPPFQFVSLFFPALLGRLVRVHPEGDVGPRGRHFAWQVPWLLLLLGVVYLHVRPTRTEALRYFGTLDGWKCCNGRGAPQRVCPPSLAHLLAAADDGVAEADRRLGECPVALERLEKR